MDGWMDGWMGPVNRDMLGICLDRLLVKHTSSPTGQTDGLTGAQAEQQYQLFPIRLCLFLFFLFLFVTPLRGRGFPTTRSLWRDDFSTACKDQRLRAGNPTL